MRGLLAEKQEVGGQQHGQKADADGLNRATLNAAKKGLGVASKKIGGTGDGWVWSLPKGTKP